MKSMKLKEVVSLLEESGFTNIRSNGHLIYAKGTVRVALSHSRDVSPGVVRSVHKAIEASMAAESYASVVQRRAA